MPFAGLFDSSLVLGSEEPESPSLSMLFQASHDFIPLYHILLHFICPLLNPSPHKSCSIPLILPVTLLCTSSAASFGQGGDGNLVKTHPTFMEQHAGLPPSSA